MQRIELIGPEGGVDVKWEHGDCADGKTGDRESCVRQFKHMIRKKYRPGKRN